MQPTDILYPVFVLIALTFFLQVRMARERTGALQRGEVSVPDIALGERKWPARAIQAANAFHNQFELPVLFYVLVAFALITSGVDVVLLVLAWLFALLRIAHAYVHSTHNDVRQRFYVYLAGSLVLTIMWAYFAVQIIAAHPRA